jgi:hypothetical protein
MTETYTAISSDGRSYTTTTVTDEQQAEFFANIETVFTEGVERFGSLAALQNAMEAYNALNRLERAA